MSVSIWKSCIFHSVVLHLISLCLSAFVNATPNQIKAQSLRALSGPWHVPDRTGPHHHFCNRKWHHEPGNQPISREDESAVHHNAVMQQIMRWTTRTEEELDVYSHVHALSKQPGRGGALCVSGYQLMSCHCCILQLRRCIVGGAARWERKENQKRKRRMKRNCTDTPESLETTEKPDGLHCGKNTFPH